MQSLMFEQNNAVLERTVLAEVDLRGSNQPLATLYIYPTPNFIGSVVVQATLRARPAETSWTTLDTIDCNNRTCVTYNASTRYVKLRVVATTIERGKIIRVAVCL